jgi:hypothetical protein
MSNNFMGNYTRDSIYCHAYRVCVVVSLITLRGFGLVTGFIYYSDYNYTDYNY